jgi:hypothetical protein
MSHRLTLRTLGLAFGLVAGGDDSDLTSFIFQNALDSEEWVLFVGQPEDVSQVLACGGPGTDDRLTVQEIIRQSRINRKTARGICAAHRTVQPLAIDVGSFVLHDNDVNGRTRNDVFGWSRIGEDGAYTVHQSVRLRIRGPTFTGVHEDVHPLVEAAGRQSGARRFCLSNTDVGLTRT